MGPKPSLSTISLSYRIDGARLVEYVTPTPFPNLYVLPSHPRLVELQAKP